MLSHWPNVDSDPIVPALRRKRVSTAKRPRLNAQRATRMAEDGRNSFGQRMEARRHELKMTQSELGLAVGVDQSVISKIAKGSFNLRIATMSKIAEALGMDLVIELRTRP